MAILITGGAGFIGSHVCDYFLEQTDDSILCLDNFNDFYEPKIKRKNISRHKKNDRFILYEGDIRDKELLDMIFSKHKISCLIHLAAMAGVRPSIEHSVLYYDVNINGTLALFEACKTHGVNRVLMASSSSVYGNNKKVPFSESDPVDHPISPYAATKKATELLAYNYYHLYGIHTACLRFFTVYGPRQRPEMAIHKFTRMIMAEQSIPVFNNGECERDYTYISDIIDGIVSIYHSPFTYDVVNLGGSQTTRTLDMIRLIEAATGKAAVMDLLPAQAGDVERTFADCHQAFEVYGYRPMVTLDLGIRLFVDWFFD